MRMNGFPLEGTGEAPFTGYKSPSRKRMEEQMSQASVIGWRGRALLMKELKEKAARRDREKS